MPTIYDNIDAKLAHGLKAALGGASSLDACVGYFNLRGWRQLSSSVDQLSADQACRLLVGMSVGPDDELREQLQAEFAGANGTAWVDRAAGQKRLDQVLEQFHKQLVFGLPNNQHEAALRKLVAHLQSKRLVIKLYVRNPLHAKLYLVKRQEMITPLIGYMGSSNLTFSGLSNNGELNIDVVDQDAANKLQRWFDDRWFDDLCIDISEKLVELIEKSWAGTRLIAPYHVYLKMAYHLSEDARLGLRDFRIPSVFGNELYDYQSAAVRIAAGYLNKQGGVLIGDVVGLGKTMMATALARLRQEDFRDSTLILSPPNLVGMWEWYRKRYELIGETISTGKRGEELKDLKRYTVVLIDESHMLRNRDTALYKNVRDYIERNESKVILLSATPYNKQYGDLAAQIRLFVSEDQDLGSRPEAAIRTAGGEVEFARKHPSINMRTIAAFEKSNEPDDWRDLMRRYLVRRTRTFIKKHYTHEDSRGRRYLLGENGKESYFPDRIPRTVAFNFDATPYAKLLQDDVVDRINQLNLPRYGLNNFIDEAAIVRSSAADRKIAEDLGRAGVRLKGFTRTGLFKRLESSGESFLLSIRRHILKNEIFLYALANDLPIPIGQQAMRELPTNETEIDTEIEVVGLDVPDDASTGGHTQFATLAQSQYNEWQSQKPKGLRWIPANLFRDDLAIALRGDTNLLMQILDIGSVWHPKTDPKLTALCELLMNKHPNEKVLIFTQFADTANYLARQLIPVIGPTLGSVTGASQKPAAIAARFSPISNKVTKAIPDELRVLITTDVLSEGQNLQDAHIVVNYDLPWAIIRLIQRVGRVDRIGQQAEQILCYSFLPADGIEQLINLRSRVQTRLDEHAQVVGADERFFEDQVDDGSGLLDLYNEQSGVLNDDGNGDVDFSSYALQIWKDATDDNAALAKQVQALEDVVFATKDHDGSRADPDGVLVFVRSQSGVDALARVDTDERIVTESPQAILDAAACEPEELAIERADHHHRLVRVGVEKAISSIGTLGTALGAGNSVRYRVYTRLKQYHEVAGRSVLTPEDVRQKLPHVYGAILASPLMEGAYSAFRNSLASGIQDEDLAWQAIDYFEQGRLVREIEQSGGKEARIKCSMGLRSR